MLPVDELIGVVVMQAKGWSSTLEAILLVTKDLILSLDGELQSVQQILRSSARYRFLL